MTTISQPTAAPDDIEVRRELDVLFEPVSLDLVKRPPLRAISALIEAPRDLGAMVGPEHRDPYVLERIETKVNPLYSYVNGTQLEWFDGCETALRALLNECLGDELAGRSGHQILARSYGRKWVTGA